MDRLLKPRSIRVGGSGRWLMFCFTDCLIQRLHFNRVSDIEIDTRIGLSPHCLPHGRRIDMAIPGRPLAVWLGSGCQRHDDHPHSREVEMMGIMDGCGRRAVTGRSDIVPGAVFGPKWVIRFSVVPIPARSNLRPRRRRVTPGTRAFASCADLARITCQYRQSAASRHGVALHDRTNPVQGIWPAGDETVYHRGRWRTDCRRRFSAGLTSIVHTPFPPMNHGIGRRHRFATLRVSTHHGSKGLSGGGGGG